jgi:DNA-binding MarR family transcriptional regulator
MATETPTREVAIGEDHEALVEQAAAMMQTMSRLMRQVKQVLLGAAPPEAARMGEGQFRALHSLCHEGRMTAGELANFCNVADPTMSKILNSLESNNLIARRTAPNNRRVVWVEVTDQGRAMHDEMLAHFRQALATILRPLDDEQLRDVIRAFHHLETVVSPQEPE